MRIERIDKALERCDAHRRSAEPMNVEVESLLTGSMLILIYSEFERKVESLILDRCLSVSDELIRKYIEESIQNVLRGIRIGELSGLLGKFDRSCKDDFKRRLKKNDRAKIMYENILENRNLVAHGEEDSKATMLDVKQYYEEGHVVLDYFRDALRGAGDAAGRGVPS